MEVLFGLLFLVLVKSFALTRMNQFTTIKNTMNIAKLPFICKMNNNMEDGVTLNSLLNTEQDGNFLKESIQRWLDEEYIPQSCHEDLGNKVKKVYITNRNKGMSDLGEMMMVHKYINMNIYIHIYICIYIYIYIIVYVYIHILNIYIHTHIYIYIYKYVYIHTYIYTYINIDTYI
jgi:hypothetical protein